MNNEQFNFSDLTSMSSIFDNQAEGFFIVVKSDLSAQVRFSFFIQVTFWALIWFATIGVFFWPFCEKYENQSIFKKDSNHSYDSYHFDYHGSNPVQV